MALTKAEKSALQKEVVDVLDYLPHGLLWLAPRIGKTKLIIDLLKRDKIDKILWVTPSANLADKDIPEEFAKWGAKRYIKRLTTTTYASLKNVVGFFDMVILDEVQHLTENNAANLLSRSIDYLSIIGMTGTPTKHEDKQELYSALKLRSLYKIDLNSAVNIGLLADYKINVVTVPMEAEKKNVEAGRKGAKFMQTEVSAYAYATDNLSRAISGGNSNAIMFSVLSRMRLVHNSPTKFKVAQKLVDGLEGRKLIFAGNIAQAEALCKNTYHSKTNGDDLRDFKSEKLNSLALVNAGGTGHTYKNLEHLILVQADSDKNGLTSQKIARTLLSQGKYKATIWIVCLLGTQDEKWIASTLNNFDKDKIEYVEFKDLKL